MIYPELCVHIEVKPEILMIVEEILDHELIRIIKETRMKKTDLTQGSILKGLIMMALPIMGTSFLQMAYNLTDMIWIGRLGSRAVAAVGTAGFFTWLGFALIRLTQIGVEVWVSQSVGRKDEVAARKYARSAVQMNFVLALLFSAFIIVFRNPLIGFFNIDDAWVNSQAIDYLVIVAAAMVFQFSNQVFSGIFNGSGDSKTPFKINTIGLIANMILDPLLIFGIGGFAGMGVKGAALATAISHIVVFTIFWITMRHQERDLFHFQIFKAPDFDAMREIFKTGLPVGVQSGAFTIFAMIIGRVIAAWGPIPIAVQKVGSQIEALSWMTASGFSTALGTFTGQNYGAKQWERIKKGYFIALQIMTVVGIMVTALLIFGAEPLFKIFIQEPESVAVGVVYLKILGLSQLFMCVEITTSGAFNGLNKTLPPSLVSIIFTGLRVPGAIILSRPELLGLEGVWWSISMSSVLKGIVLVGWFSTLLLTSRLTPDWKQKSKSDVCCES